MIKRKSILLLLVLFLVFCVNVNTATQNYIPRNVEIDRSRIPKNILFGSFIGGRSHVKPMLEIAEILIKRGYNITLLTRGYYEPSSEYPAVKQISLGPKFGFRDLNMKGIDKQIDHTRLSMIMELGVKYYNETYEKFKNVAKEYNTDLFFCDLLLNDPCIDIAHTLKKPVVGIASLLQLMDYKPYKSDPMFGCNISLENESIWGRLKCSLIRPLQIFFSIRSVANQLNDAKKQKNIEPGQATFVNTKVSLALADTFFGFELPQTLPPNVLEIGPLMSEEYPPLTPELSDFINGHERVLYVAFGTNFFGTIDNNSKLLQAFVEAINKKVIDGVVWALVQTSKDEFHPVLSLTDGTQIRTSQILNNEHPHIRIVKFAPQFAVLNHTNTKLFFSHGGAGSSHESLYTGTPMLVLPFGADQVGNAQKLKTAGVALSLNKDNIDVSDVINKMGSILNDENVKKNSERMKVLAQINSKRKYRAADLVEYMLYSSTFVEYVDDDFLKEWVPAEARMGFIKANNLDIYGGLISFVLGLIGIIIIKLIYLFKIPSSVNPKSKRE